ncbi:hypothetical protein RI129_009820 [Pyrocoelia pectoralis]|uniref:DRBM domain-containing protein n=1 Tax=Pyrocoelia pectoralis TaxID=417401 RepID=A0AAN7ZJ96_9COLE
MDNSKSPVTILQELAMSKKWTLPEYTLIQSKLGTHSTEFHYQVSINGEMAMGIGRSKKQAKQCAASMLLDKLPKTSDNDSMESNIPKKKMKLTNCISDLIGLCSKNKLPSPVFIQVSQTGPDHCKEFTFECKVISITTRGTANSKKQAQHYAAQEMIDKITSILPDLVAEYHKQTFPTKEEEEVKEQSSRIQLSKPEPDSSAKLEKETKKTSELQQTSPIIQTEPKESGVDNFIGSPIKLAKPDSSVTAEIEEKSESIQSTDIKPNLSENATNITPVEKGENS